MNLFSALLGGLSSWFGKAKNYIKYSIGTAMQTFNVNGVTGMPEKIGTVYTCCRILSMNLSRMPLSVFIDNENGRQEMARHRLTYLLKFRPNAYQNAQQFWSTLEYHRNYFGNAFARIYKNAGTSYPTALEIIHPGQIKEYFFEYGELYYRVINQNNQTEEIISAWDMLHFRGLSEDGIIGLSPLVAIERQTNINERGTSTIDNFYKNNATAPIAITQDWPTGSIGGQHFQKLSESKDQFNDANAGPLNAGKPITLNPGQKIQTLPLQFADANIIATLKFTREDISAAYGIPLFMVDGSAEKLDVEQLTTLFKNNTMGPVVSIYMAEINGKLLTRNELSMGMTVQFDVMSLIGMDYQTLVSGIKEQVVNGLMTPNEGAKRLGNKPINGEYANMHYMQAQYIPLENYASFNKLLKNDPTLKTKSNEK